MLRIGRCPETLRRLKMRGATDSQSSMFLMINLELKVPLDHPLRAIKRRADAILRGMRRDFDAAYSRTGRPGVPPEQLLKAMLLQALYSIRSEIQLMQAIDFNLLYRWFLDLADRPVWTPEVFSMNRARFAEHDLVRKFFDRIVHEAVVEGYASTDHFTVDGTLIRSWASLKSLRPKDGPEPPRTDDDPGNPSVDFRGERRTNQTHVSATDPEARLMRKGKGQPAYLCHSGHVLMENRNGLCMAVAVDQADGKAERRSATSLLKHLRRRHGIHVKTLGMDKGYDGGAFLAELERLHIEAHVPVPPVRTGSEEAPARARRRAHRRMGTKGYEASQRIRKRVEEIFGWLKSVAGLARARLVGRWKIGQEMLISGAAYNLLRMARLEAVG
jgi:transposase